MKSGKVSREHFSLGYPLRDIANGLYAAYKARVELDGDTFRPDEDTLAHIKSAAEWLTDAEGKTGLMLLGMYGNGKTTLARAIASLVEFVTQTENGYAGRKHIEFYTAKDICRMCKAQEKSPEAYRKPFSDEMMILDELGEEPEEVLVYGMPETPIHDLLGHRYAKHRLTIITTNLNADQLKEKYRGRLYDRMRKMFATITFENGTYRN